MGILDQTLIPIGGRLTVISISIIFATSIAGVVAEATLAVDAEGPMIGVGSLTRGALGTSIALIIGTTAICLEVLALGALDWAWERPSGNVWCNLWS